MIRITYLFGLFLALCTIANGQVSSNMLMLGNYDDNSLAFSNGVQYNDVWGYAVTDANGVDREFAVVGARELVLFLEVTDPANITEVAAIGGGSNTTWRDMKTFGEYAYSVTDGSTTEGLLIFDMTNITGPDPVNIGDPERVTLANQITTYFTKCHNVFIDENGYLYAVGFSNTSGSDDDIIIFDLNANPTNPPVLAQLSVNGGYIHDIFVENHIAYASSGNDGHFIFNMAPVTNPAVGVAPGVPVELGLLNEYLFEGYSHSSWVAGDYMIFADETWGTPMGIVDVSDPSDLQMLDRFHSNLLGVANPTQATGTSRGPIVHNPFIVGDLCYVSHYHDGVVVFDISDPTNVKQVGHYDTYTNNTNYVGYDGVWGVYPFLPSGRILGTDTHNGLFVLEYVAALPVSWGDVQAEAKTTHIVLDWTTESESENMGFFVERQAADGSWKELSFVQPNAGQRYQFLDRNPLPGDNIYRIVQEDFDGQQGFSPLVSAKWESFTGDWQVYPNPLNSGQELYLSNWSGTEEPLDIRNLQGQLLHRSFIKEGDNAIHLPLLASGLYWISDGQGHTQKLVIRP